MQLDEIWNSPVGRKKTQLGMNAHKYLGKYIHFLSQGSRKPSTQHICRMSRIQTRNKTDTGTPINVMVSRPKMFRDVCNKLHAPVVSFGQRLQGRSNLMHSSARSGNWLVISAISIDGNNLSDTTPVGACRQADLLSVFSHAFLAPSTAINRPSQLLQNSSSASFASLQSNYFLAGSSTKRPTALIPNIYSQK